jgi:8-oxo-dGTP pyrophosphatase MutT (NUDIX family)
MPKRALAQVAALPWRRRRGRIEALLITSRETKRWVIPKGWPMQHLMDFNAARREAFEEAGVVGRVRRKALGHFHYNKIRRNGTADLCRVTVYMLEVEAEHRRWPESHERKRKWFAAGDAAKLVAEPELKALLLRLR